jgi:hypothetical protein
MAHGSYSCIDVASCIIDNEWIVRKGSDLHGFRFLTDGNRCRATADTGRELAHGWILGE